MDNDEIKEKLRLKNKAYYAENKVKLQTNYKAKVVCLLCDKSVCHGSINTHMKSKLCIKGQNLKHKLINILHIDETETKQMD